MDDRKIDRQAGESKVLESFRYQSGLVIPSIEVLVLLKGVEKKYQTTSNRSNLSFDFLFGTN